MTNKKLLMFALAGAVLPATAAQAEIKGHSETMMAPAPTQRFAPVGGTPARLRRTDEFQPGAEMATMAMFTDADGKQKSGLYFYMAGEINGVLANRRIQGGLIPFTLTQAADGSVAATPDMAKAGFITNNNGNEYRQFNHPFAYPIANGTMIAVEYNYQPNNTNDTRRYLQVFDRNGNNVLPQTQIYAKNNDDCSMNQDGASTKVVSQTATRTRLVAWRGCNGNGQDDGWLQAFSVDTSGAQAKFVAEFDVSLCPREERSHGTVHVTPDGKTAIATWTEGNNQPQRDGTWMAAVALDAGAAGADQQQTILWKKQIDGRKDQDGIRTYSMRAMTVQLTDTAGAPTNRFLWRSGDLRGNNNTNNGKGGTYYRSQMGVIEADANGMKFVTPLTDVAPKTLGLDGTHLGMSYGKFGTADRSVDGVAFVSGSHTGGGYSAQVRVVTWDSTASTFADAGMYNVAPYDRHLYPNYLGNNPGNQGRNYADTHMIANPFLGSNGNTDTQLMLVATTGKAPADMSKPEVLASAYLSVLPIQQTAKADPGTGTGSGSGSGSGGLETPPGGDDDGGAQDSLGGCSAGSGSAGLATFLLIGLAAFIRRRR